MLENLIGRIRRFIHPPVLGDVIPTGNSMSNAEIGLNGMCNAAPPITVNVVDPTVVRKLSRTDIVELMKNSGGRFFTVVFIKADGTERTINGQVKKDEFYDSQGYIIFRESNGNFRKVNPITIKEISISKQIYKVKVR